VPSTVLADADVAGVVVVVVVVVVVGDAGAVVDDSVVPSNGIEGVVLLGAAT
jgi:hypothetical protein